MESKGSSIASGVVNLTNTIVGAGMLGLPGAFGGTGWLSGVVLITLSASFSAHGLVLLSKAACITGRPSSFYSVALASVPRYTILIDLAVALKCFGVATGYLITISDSMVNALDHILLTGDPVNDERFLISLLLSRHFWVIGALVLVLPFSFYRTLDELKKASALALVFVFMLVGMIIGYANGIADPCMGNENEYGDSCRGEIEPFTNFPLTLSKLPIFVFAFTCHQNIFPIVNEIQSVTQFRLNIVICCSIGFALVLFSVVALEGYWTYGSLVRGDILLNYPENNQVTFLRVCIAFMLALHYPLQLDPSRRCITSIVRVVINVWRSNKGSNSTSKKFSGDPLSVIDHSSSIEMEQEESLETAHELSKDYLYYDMSQNNAKQRRADDIDNKLFNAITLSFLSLSFTLAMIVDDLGVVLALVGATGSTLVSYVLPGLIYVKVCPRMDLSKMMAYLQLGVGIIIIPLAL
eukprot:CAMPEP_0172531184 /NCGR_PEP_ID=MMETSP1067-20121228/4689_1 /TAXON_ID=265564 ORGANISM="Thalassiosira punctigera, Strain Tpunct2005C2" /NCGR_SAMPLE_ID=MMETSP1067 /ASSEMBLY_ACC=CAM_ASM_000444 /LENGTH=466 /DNA_ID=CAMNT_0013315535 /DNA_START=64 /DNA_END=1461 /DNA_ORIENTATION=-